MMNVGVDIEEVHRFKQLIRNKRFMERVFTKAETAYCSAKKNNLQHFAVRFAAKEAVWKALSTWLHKKKTSLSHRDIGVKNNDQGKPEVHLPSNLKKVSQKISLSLSHTQSTAVAVAIFQE